jgi:hypothetical protein
MMGMKFARFDLLRSLEDSRVMLEKTAVAGP